MLRNVAVTSVKFQVGKGVEHRIYLKDLITEN